MNPGPADALRVLRDVFHQDGYKNENQRVATESILAGDNLNNIVNAAPNAERSLIAQIRGYLTDGLTIEFTPSLASIHDKMKKFQLLGIECATINSSTPNDERDEIKNKIWRRDSGLKYLFITPEIFGYSGNAMNREWFRTFLSMSDEDRRVLNVKPINCIVVDEAQRIVESADNRYDFHLLWEFRAMTPTTPWIALMTGNREMEQEVTQFLSMENPRIFTSSSRIENLFYRVIMDGTIEGERVIDVIRNFFSVGKRSGIIFCRNCNEIELTINYLTQHGITSSAYHGNISGIVRENIIERWISGGISIIVATGDSFGVGSNYFAPEVGFVISLGITSITCFYHQSARAAGNDDSVGYSVTFGGVDFIPGSLLTQELVDFNDAECLVQFLAAHNGEDIGICETQCNLCFERRQEQNNHGN